MSLLIHPIDFKESVAAGMIADLPPHSAAFSVWGDCGYTAPPGLPCSAATSEKARCLKVAIVLLAARSKYSRSDSEDVGLCGGHFIIHRDGRSMLIFATPARAR